nr:MAG TPA: hypothetical protein [Bacteriophage sp.]DAR39683.1 MAG TPA: hypothetical protein [Caudoviricetes sp.]
MFQCKALYRIIFPYSRVSDYLLYLSYSIIVSWIKFYIVSLV